MKKILFNALKFVFFLSLGLGLFWVVIRDIDFWEMIKRIGDADYTWIGLAMIVTFIAHLSRALRWNLLIKPLGYSPRIINSFFAVMIGYLANLGLPRLGEIIRPGILKKYEKIPLSSLIGTIIIERAIDFLALFVLMILTFVLQFERIRNFLLSTIIPSFEEKFLSGDNSQVFWWIIFGSVVLLVVAIPIFLRSIRHTGFYHKLVEVIRGLGDGIKTIKNMENNIAFIMHTIVIWMCYYLMAYLCVFSIPETSRLGPMAGLSILTLGALGIVAPVQGGIGTYHWIVSKTLTIYDIPLNDGVVYATITHAAQTVFVIVFGFLSLILIPVFSRRSTTNE